MRPMRCHILIRLSNKGHSLYALVQVAELPESVVHIWLTRQRDALPDNDTSVVQHVLELELLGRRQVHRLEGSIPSEGRRFSHPGFQKKLLHGGPQAGCRRV